MARSRRRATRNARSNPKNTRVESAAKKAARRRAGDAAEMTRFRDGVRVRAARMPNKKREAARRACRGPGLRP
ncbi:MAG: hypothetical protein EBR06_00755 [Acidimicrobiia bacterium]|nr:hypothetical protein [Acidimicrobiia bacterium]